MRCTCGTLFTGQAVLAGKTVWFWCPACDGHGTGCTDRTHPANRPCTYPPNPKGGAWRNRS